MIVCAHAITYMLRSEDNLRELIFVLLARGLLRSNLGCQARLTHWANLLASSPLLITQVLGNWPPTLTPSRDSVLRGHLIHHKVLRYKWYNKRSCGFSRKYSSQSLVLNDWSIASDAVLGGSRNFRMGFLEEAVFGVSLVPSCHTLSFRLSQEDSCLLPRGPHCHLLSIHMGSYNSPQNSESVRKCTSLQLLLQHLVTVTERQLKGC